MRKVDPLLVNYSIRIREVILVILIILSTLFFAMPKFLDEAQAGDEDNQIEVETFDIPPTQMVEQQKPLKPAIPVPEDDEFFEEG